MSLLHDATNEDVRLKMYVYGDSGTGKTITSLHFPNPVVIDPEKGTVHYSKYFSFKRSYTKNVKEVKAIIDELLTDPGDAKTLVIDPITLIYEEIIRSYETKLRLKKGDPAYTLQPLDYKVIKSEVKSLVDKILALDMNIIVTARASALYSTDEFMKQIGLKPDGPKDLPYAFDVVLELTKDEKTGKFIAHTKKDRTNTLPIDFEFSYESFVSHIGIKSLERAPVQFKQTAKLNEVQGRYHVARFMEKDVNTAGVTSETLDKLYRISLSYGQDKLQEKLHEDYYLDSIFDLKEDEALLLIKSIAGELNKNESTDKGV